MANYSVNSRGTCVPKDKATLFAFKGVQIGANRFLSASKKKLLACDGKLGKSTVAAVNSVSTMFPTSGLLGSPVTSCKQIADRPVDYVLAMNNIATNVNPILPVPACPSGLIQKITHPEPEIRADGTIAYQDPASAGLAGVPYWLMALIAAGGGYYYFFQTPGGKKQLRALRGGR